MLPPSPNDPYDDYFSGIDNGYYAAYNANTGMDHYIGHHSHDDNNRYYSGLDHVFQTNEFFRYQDTSNSNLINETKEEVTEEGNNGRGNNYGDNYGSDIRHDIISDTDIQMHSIARILMEDVEGRNCKDGGSEGQQHFPIPIRTQSRGKPMIYATGRSSSPEYGTKTKKQPRRKNNKDVELAKKNNIPASPSEIAEFSYEQLKNFISKYQFSEEQITLIKAIRRRGRNKKSVALYRQKKGSSYHHHHHHLTNSQQ
uniref:BZIP_Maf domain-containing protein n=1 Tax=Parastrongyloides trichosuri TaxID=131310 RepID=A0A0N4Z2N0_PARTI